MRRDEFKTEIGRKFFDECVSIVGKKEKSVEETRTKYNSHAQSMTPNYTSPLESIFDTIPASQVLRPQSIIEEPIWMSEQPAHRKPEAVHRQLNTYSITQYVRNEGVVGEEANAILLTIGISNGLHTILEGDSGSGKSFLVDRILALYPRDQLYELGLTSGQAIWRDTEALNNANIIYIPELQKAMGSRKSLSIIEAIKNLSEGKNARRIVTNAKKNGVDEYTIASGKTIVSTIARENSFTYDRETQRRFIILETDNSQQHIEDIIEAKVSDRLSGLFQDKDVSVAADLSARVSDVSPLPVLNPFLPYLRQAFPAMPKAQAYLDHYLNLFDAYGRFFAPERERVTHHGKIAALLELEDIHTVYSLYHNQFIKTLSSFTTEQPPVFTPDWGLCYNAGVQTMRTLFSNNDFEYWVEKQRDGRLLNTTDYKTGERIVIGEQPGRITDKRRLLTGGTHA